MQPLIGELPHEEFWVLYLNSTNRMIHKARLFSGGITQTTVDVRLLFKTALEQGAIALILVHNHPSGNTTPSKEDIELTQRVKTAGDMLDIKLLDHVIVTEKEYLSLLDERLCIGRGRLGSRLYPLCAYRLTYSLPRNAYSPS